MLSELLRIKDLLESAGSDGEAVREYFRPFDIDVTVVPLGTKDARVDLLRLTIPGSDGRSNGGSAPTLGIIGRLGGLAARGKFGLVSDADGALVALTAAAKLARFRRAGQHASGDTIVTTNITRAGCVRGQFISSPIDSREIGPLEVLPEMAAIVSIDATKANRVLNRTGVAITPTVKEGYVLRVSEGLLTLVERVTSAPALVLPVTTQDITSMANGVYHINSIMQPSRYTTAPVVGIALTSAVLIPGSATGVTNVALLESAARLCLEMAREFGAGELHFFDPGEFAVLMRLYGSLRRLQEDPEPTPKGT